MLFPPVRIILNRSLRRCQKGVEAFLDDGVALARGLFEAVTIKDLHVPPTISDEALSLQSLRCKRHRLASGAQGDDITPCPQDCAAEEKLGTPKGGGLPTVYQGLFSVAREGLKVVPVFNMAQATLRRRSAIDRRARPWL
jgi:hypothetical protein